MRTSTVLLTLGRLPKGLDLARSFHRAGYRVIVADPFRWHLSRVSTAIDRSFQVTAPSESPTRYIDDLLGLIRREKVSMVIPVSEESMYVAALKTEVPPEVRVYGMAQASLTTLHDKRSFIDLAARFGLAVPETHHVDDPRAVRLAARHDHVLKPTNGCAGKGVRIEKRGTPLAHEMHDRAWIVQRFIEGQQVSSFSLVDEGRVLLTVMYRGTVMSGTVAVGLARIDRQPSIEAWIKRFVGPLGYSGFIGFDFMVEDSGTALAIECNPRVTSGIHFVNTDVLAPMMLDPKSAPPPTLSPDRYVQQFWPCLTETQASLFCWPRFRAHLGSLLRSRDVTWAWRDPLPFLLMPLTSMNMLWTAMTTTKTLGEAATDDIAWRPEARLPHPDPLDTIMKADAAPGI